MVDLDDQRFRDVFDSLGGSAPDSHDGARDLLPRIARARRRRRMERFGALTIVVVLAATTALVLRERGHDRVTVVNTPTTSATITLAPPRTTATITTTTPLPTTGAVTPAPPTASPPGTATTPAIADDTAAGPSGDATSNETPAPSTGSAPPSTPRSTSPVTGPPPATTPSTPPSTEPATTEPTTESETSDSVEHRPPTVTATESFSSTGGSITLRTDGSTITVVAVDPAPGWAVAELDTAPDQVKVRFGSPSQQTSIRVELEDGHLHEKHDD